MLVLGAEGCSPRGGCGRGGRAPHLPAAGWPWPGSAHRDKGPDEGLQH